MKKARPVDRMVEVIAREFDALERAEKALDERLARISWNAEPGKFWYVLAQLQIIRRKRIRLGAIPRIR